MALLLFAVNAVKKPQLSVDEASESIVAVEKYISILSMIVRTC
jgi:hypothetical protein